jgi:hypothetical protein
LSHSTRLLMTIMLVALWFFLAACSSDDDDGGNPIIEPDPFDASHLMGFWNCSEENEDSYPFTSLSFGDLSSGMLGTQSTLDYFSWTATDSTLLLNLIDGIRTYNYSVENDTLDVWVGQGGRLEFAHIFEADTVYIEQNPYRVTLAVPETQQVRLLLLDETGIEVASLYDSELDIGLYVIYIEYPQDVVDQVLAFDAIRGSDYHLRQYRYVTNRPEISFDAADLVTVHYADAEYRAREFEFATAEEYGDAFEGTVEEWNDVSIEERVLFLPGNFRRILPGSVNDSFIWYIADYPYQFGYGWPDAVEDDTLTVEWDGSSAKLTELRQLLGLE